MNKSTDSTNTELDNTDCPHCSASSIILSSNFNNKQYLLYFQNDSIRLIEMDDIGMEVLGEVKVGFCMGCGREL